MTKPFNSTLAIVTATMAAVSAQAANLLGVDVSSLQGSINWTSVAGDGVQFAFVRATEGTTFQDPNYVANMTHGKSAGLQMGAYEYSEPALNTPSAEANYFWGYAGSNIKVDGKSISPVIDFEVFSGHIGAPTYTQWFNTWSLDIKAKTTAFIRPSIYVAPCSGACDLNTNIMLEAFVANPAGTLSNPWGACTSCNAWDPNGTGNWTYWQSSDTGRISGISGDVDLDVYKGTLANLKSTQGVGL